jgi:transposase
MGKRAAALEVTPEDQSTLRGLVRARKTPQRVSLRARIVLAAAAGQAQLTITQTLGVSRPTVALWRQRFAAGGVAALQHDAPGRGRPRTLSQARVDALVHATTQTTPKGATHWSTRSMAAQCGVSNATVARIWQAHGLQPHRVKTFKLSRDPHFAEKLRDVVGLYLHPPAKALVLSVDEKSQIQALDRTQPGLPIKKGRCGTMTHDYTRHGTTTLFAALNVLEGQVLGACYPRHRNGEFRQFLAVIDRQTPPDLALHLIVDNYATHKPPQVQRWLTRHPRFHLHFTPTSASWLNQVERWFRELTTQRIRRGVFQSMPDLVAAIEEYLQVQNANPKPFVWTATADQILAKVSKCKAILETLH